MVIQFIRYIEYAQFQALLILCHIFQLIHLKFKLNHNRCLIFYFHRLRGFPIDYQCIIRYGKAFAKLLIIFANCDGNHLLHTTLDINGHQATLGAFIHFQSVQFVLLTCIVNMIRNSNEQSAIFDILMTNVAFINFMVLIFIAVQQEIAHVLDTHCIVIA